MPRARVLSVGQCGYDHAGLSRTLTHWFDVEVIAAEGRQDALETLRSSVIDLVLVNRVFDSDGDSGLDFLGEVLADPSTAGVPAMLVSNYSEAQERAVSLGARPGFGKATLRDPRTRELLEAVLPRAE